jgi:hypothetical protein
MKATLLPKFEHYAYWMTLYQAKARAVVNARFWTVVCSKAYSNFSKEGFLTGSYLIV